MDKETFCKEIIECLVEYGDLSVEEAELLVSASRICAFDSDDEFELLFHETPYYWAMWLKYSKINPDWHKDPSLWPPPKEYLEKWYKTK